MGPSDPATGEATLTSDVPDPHAHKKALPAADAEPTYLRLVPATGAAAVVRLVAGAPVAPRVRRAPARVEAALAALTELAASSTGAGLARLAVPGEARVWWAGPERADAAPLPEASRALQHLLEAGDAEVIDDLRADPRFAAVPPVGLYAWCRTLACIPVAGDGARTGMLTVFIAAPGGLDPTACESLQRLALLAGSIAAEAGRRHEAARRRRDERRAERDLRRATANVQRALSRQLHEDVANQLAGTALLVQSLVNRGGVEEALSYDLALVSRDLHVALRKCRRIACANSAYLIDAHGLSEALGIVLRQMKRPGEATIGVVAAAQAGAHFGRSVALCLLDLAETAVRLACRTRATRRVTVRLRPLGNGGVELRVAADSAWITPQPDMPPAHGWEGLRHLTRRIGADVTTSTGVDGGHRLIVTLRRVARRECRPAAR